MGVDEVVDNRWGLIRWSGVNVFRMIWGRSGLMEYVFMCVGYYEYVLVIYALVICVNILHKQIFTILFHHVKP